MHGAIRPLPFLAQDHIVGPSPWNDATSKGKALLGGEVDWGCDGFGPERMLTMEDLRIGRRNGKPWFRPC